MVVLLEGKVRGDWAPGFCLVWERNLRLATAISGVSVALAAEAVVAVFDALLAAVWDWLVAEVAGKEGDVETVNGELRGFDAPPTLATVVVELFLGDDVPLPPFPLDCSRFLFYTSCYYICFHAI